MTPIRFGEPSRQLFGLFQSPSGNVGRQHGVLLCNPFGQEAIRAHRLLRILADRLSRNGFHVLRFDYFATGDSDGNDDEGNLRTWAADTLRAHEELARLSGCRKRSWFGLRLGATIAALASATTEASLERLVMWDPIIDGAGYLIELEMAHDKTLEFDGNDIAGPPETPPMQATSDFAEALGFPLTPDFQQEIRALWIGSVAASRAAQVTLIGCSASKDPVALERLFEAGGVPFVFRPIGSRIVWTSDEALNSAIVPADALEAIVESLSE